MQCSITCRIWIQDWCFERFYRLSWKIYTPSTRWSYLGDNVPTVRHVQWWHYGCGIVWSDTGEEKQVQRQKKPQQQPTHRKSTGLLEASAFSELPTNTQIQFQSYPQPLSASHCDITHKCITPEKWGYRYHISYRYPSPLAWPVGYEISIYIESGYNPTSVFDDTYWYYSFYSPVKDA